MLAVHLNYQKSFSEKRQDATPAQRLGIATERLRTRALLAERFFPMRVRLSEIWKRYYRREVVTRCLPSGRRHALGYAY